MLTKQDCIQKIQDQQHILFYKPGCPYCAASKILMEELQEAGIIDNFQIYYVRKDQDLTNEVLLEVMKEYGWQGDQDQVPSKPQVFIYGESVGGNDDFYNSKWNHGEDGKLSIENTVYTTPQLDNPRG